FAFLPADTRLPDHTVWTHMQVVSALDGCADRSGKDALLTPAFLKFQLGPVQDFIAAARSIRDLWSGSYLLSWLMAAGMKALSAEVGPDAVIFPNLRGQPLFDLQWRQELWGRVAIGDQTVWQSLDWKNRQLLTPNLPNVFLAVVPAGRAAELGELTKKAIEEEWRQIAEAVWTECRTAGLTADEGGISTTERKARFDTQIGRFLSISWQATPWPSSLENALELAEGFDSEMPIRKARERVLAVVKLATGQMSIEHRDRRYYTDDSKTKLNNIGLGWSVILALNGWALDAVRQTRQFEAVNPGGWQVGVFNNKDALSGRDEAVAGGEVWTDKAEKLGGSWKSLFKHSDWLGAATLVKRVWHLAYLARSPWKLETTPRGFPMPNTRGIAAHQPEEDCGEDETTDNVPGSENYFAVLAFDGDEIGKWISGEKTPPFSSQLADYFDGSNSQRFGAKTYFDKPELRGFLEAQRPLSPSYHLQFSEALGNFALLCARPIVEAFDGRLIYAGGDDVVALLPADTALVCAEALRRAFTGREVSARDGRVLFARSAPGFLSSDGWKDDHGRGRPIPFIVPGPAADASVGIAIAHFKSPLQDVVRAAQAAERRAKSPKGLDRSAVAVTLMKRSGETIEWGCRWEGGGLDLYRAMAGALAADQLSNKFPHRMVEVLEPYLTNHTGLATGKTASEFEAVVDEIISRETAIACERQRGEAWKGHVTEELVRLLPLYLMGCKGAETKLRAIIGLCQTVAFAHRTRQKRQSSDSIPTASIAEKQTP
ncbi:MAG: type III-B CRISPR-associated protein Cas10/Cmr2, partial [Limisphaerales bacterium]